MSSDAPKRIHIIACRVLTRELSARIAQSDNIVSIDWMPQGMHDIPQTLHNNLVEALERVYDQIDRHQTRYTPDCIALGYGLCSKATVGLEATRVPLVIPRTEDCIALFLGSQERYMQYFKEYPGTYWLNSGWIENMPETEPDYLDKLRQQYMEQYDDEDTVDYLMEMEGNILSEYKAMGYIRSDTRDNDALRQKAREYTQHFGLDFLEFEGDGTMLDKMVSGDFDEQNFLTVPVGYKVAYSNGPERMVAEKV